MTEEIVMIQFERKISLDTVLVLIGIVISGIAFWTKMDSRLGVVEARTVEDHQVIMGIYQNNTKLTTLMDQYVIPKLDRIDGPVIRAGRPQ